MRRIGLLIFLGLLATLLIFPAVRAEEKKTDGQMPSLTGNIEGGFRLVDVDGSRNKFREHYNLDTGPRLLNLSLNGNYRSSRILDDFRLQANGVGGDPYQNYSLLVNKDRLYTFEASFKKSDYFYNTITYPVSRPDGNQTSFEEAHAFGTSRENTDFKLTIKPENLFKLTLGYSRMEKEGTTFLTALTTAVPPDVTLITTPVDEIDDFYFASAEFSLSIFDFYFEQDYRKSDNKLNFLSDPTANAAVELHESQTVKESLQTLRQPISRAKVHTLLFDKLDLSTNLVYSNSDFDVDINRPKDQFQAVRPPTTGEGSLNKKIWIWDMEASYSLLNSLTVHGIGQISELKQNGNITFTGSSRDTTEDGTVINKIFSHTVGAELEYVPLKDLSLNGGIKRQFRKLDFTRISQFNPPPPIENPVILQSGDTIYTLGFFWKPLTSLDFMGRVLIGEFNNPYTNISSTDTENIKFRVRYRPLRTLAFSATHAERNTENTTTFFKSNFKSDGISIGYQPVAKLDLNVGYTLQEGKSFSFFSSADAACFAFNPDAVNLCGGVNGAFVAEYQARSNILSADALYAITKKIKVGLDVRNIESSGTISFHFSDLGVFLGYLWPYNLETKLKYQWITYDEVVLNANDYVASVVTLSLGLNF